MNVLRDDITGSYISRRTKERIEIKKALENDILQHNFKYFRNFIVIGNKTYNGWNRKMIEDIVNEIMEIKPKERVINISEFEFED